MKRVLFIFGMFLLLSCSITTTKKVTLNFVQERPEALISFLDSKQAEYDKADILC